MNPRVVCPCGVEGEPTFEEVDIGVGVQQFQSGWECPLHGGLCGVCGSCGCADRPGHTHEKWCSERPGVAITIESFEAETDELANRVVDRFKARTT